MKSDAAIGSDAAGENCLSQVISKGYACGSAPPCSACKDNQTSKAAECQAVLDCIMGEFGIRFHVHLDQQPRTVGADRFGAER